MGKGGPPRASRTHACVSVASVRRTSTGARCLMPAPLILECPRCPRCLTRICCEDSDRRARWPRQIPRNAGLRAGPESASNVVRPCPFPAADHQFLQGTGPRSIDHPLRSIPRWASGDERPYPRHSRMQAQTGRTIQNRPTRMRVGTHFHFLPVGQFTLGRAHGALVDT